MVLEGRDHLYYLVYVSSIWQGAHPPKDGAITLGALIFFGKYLPLQILTGIGVASSTLEGRRVSELRLFGCWEGDVSVYD